MWSHSYHERIFFHSRRIINIDEQNINTHQPYGVFCLNVTKNLLNIFALQTNRNTTYFNSLTVTRRSRDKSWSPTINSKIKNFFGIILCMNLVKMHEMYVHLSKVNDNS